ncbi:MAG: hypothetical protein ACRDSR_07085 [Pseudonocardiaceae bacterium]
MSRRDAEERQVSIDVAWCPVCRADCTVEVTALAGDPEPVAICVGCDLGMQAGWLLETAYEMGMAGRAVPAP